MYYNKGTKSLYRTDFTYFTQIMEICFDCNTKFIFEIHYYSVVIETNSPLSI